MAKPDKIDTDAEAIDAITGAGYTSIANLEQHGSTWHCSAVNGTTGEPVKIVVSGNGKVHEKDEDDGDSAAEPEPEPKE